VMSIHFCFKATKTLAFFEQQKDNRDGIIYNFSRRLYGNQSKVREEAR
jgi:hypothetical protein